MLLKKLVISLSSAVFAVNVSIFAVNEIEPNTQEINSSAEITEKRADGEFSMFGIFSESYYKDIIRCSEGIRDYAKAAAESLEKIEKNVEKEKDSGDLISDEFKDNFKEFLVKQNKLDDSTRELLKILGLFSDVDTKEDIDEDKKLNSTELAKE